MAETAKTVASVGKSPDEFAQDLAAMIANGVAPWQKNWKAGEYFSPFNPVSGTTYKGVNNLSLASTGLADPRWLTFKQASEQGYRVRKGAKSRPVVYWQWTKEVARKDENGQPIIGADGTRETETVPLDKPRIYRYRVFNSTQLETEKHQALPIFQAPPLTWNPSERIESLLAQSGVVIHHDRRDGAAYNPTTDEIHLPPRENFNDSASYYNVLLHELGHWACSNRRLGMEGGAYGSAGYAQEELRVEIASWLLAQELQIDFVPENSAAYMAHWLENLENDSYEIFRATRDAERIKKYVLGLELEREQGEVLAFTDLKADKAETPWYGNLTLPNNFTPLQPDLLALTENASTAEKEVLATFYAEFLNITEKVMDTTKPFCEKDGRELDLDDRRSILAGTLAEALLAHQKMIELKLLAPESRFARQDLAESIKGIETVAKVNRNLKQKAVPNLPPNLSAPEEFAEVLRESGFILEGTPVLDGAIHRVRVEGGHGSSKDGAYCSYLNGGKGPAAGWYVNHKDGGEVKKWVGTGHNMSEEQKKILRTEITETKKQQEQERLEAHEVACATIKAKIENEEWIPATDEHPFLKAKQVPSYGLLKNEKNNLLAVGIDLDKSIFGRAEGAGLAPPTKRSEMVLRKTIQVAQIISPSGYKQFKKNCIAKGAMFLIGEEQFKDVAFEEIRPDHLLDDRGKPPPEILVAEGYTTGATLHRATNLPVAVAFNAGNLKPVAEALRRKFPTATLTICADNDHQIKTNVGIEKAAEAAKIVGGELIFPDFTSAEKQQKLTDFNDLAQSRGLVAVTEIMRQKRQTAQNNIPQMGR